MSKSSIICNSCGEENDPITTFCIECGTSMATSDPDASAGLEESKQTSDKSFQPETSPSSSESQPKSRSGHRPMMMGMKPMFLIMPMMFMIMAGVFIFIIFFSDGKLPFGN